MENTNTAYNEILMLQKAVESSDEAIFITDLTGLITYINPGFTKLYGYSADEVIGKTTPRILKSGLMKPDDYKYFWTNILGGRSVRGELMNKTKDGRLITIEGSANTVLNDKNEIIGFIGIQHDITLRKQTEEALRKSEEMFRKASEISPDAIIITRLSDGMIVSVNEAFTKILGYSEEETIGKTSIELNIWADKEKRDEIVKEVTGKGRVENFNAIFLNKDGGIVNGLMSASLIDLDGVPHLLTVTKDITIRKRVEERLADEQFLVTALMDNIPDHVYFKDLESRFIRINKSHAARFGFNDPSDAVGKTDFDYFSAEHAQQAFDDEQEIIRTGKVLSKEERETHSDKPDTWVSTVKMPLRDKAGNIIGTFGISRDITQQRKAEEQFFLLANALKSTNECVSITDMNDNVLFLNKAFTDTYGFTEDDLKEENISQIRSLKNQLEISEKILPETLKGGWHGELWNRRKDGSEFLVDLSTAVVKNTSGAPVALIGIANDITEKKKIEVALKQSEERFRSVTQSANDAIISVDSKGKILGWNHGAEIAFGYKESEIVGSSLNSIIPENYLNKHIKGRVRLEAKGDKHVIGKTVELHGKRKNGDIFPLELSLSEWETSEGNFFTGIIRDISRRKRTEQENQMIFEITQGITLTSNLDELLNLIHISLAKIVYAENFFVALYNQKTELFSFPYFVDKFDTTPEPTAMRRSCSAYVFRTGKSFLFTTELFMQLEQQNEVELVGSASPSWIGIPLKSPSKVIGVLVLQHYEKENVYSENDVRFLESIGGQIAFAIERKQAESALRESERDLYESQKIAGLGSYNLDFINGTWTSSEILDSIFGIDEKYERTISGWAEIIHPDWREQMTTYLQKNVIGNREMFDKEYKIVRRTDNSERWVHGRGELLYDHNGVLVSMIGNIVDITQRKLAEEEIKLKNELLQTINAEKDKFFSIIAHDLRGPLSSFVAATQIITEEIQTMSVDEIKDITLSMKTSATGIYSLLENLLEWSRLRRGIMDFVPGRINLKKMAEECIKVLAESAHKKDIKIDISISENVNIFADNHMLDAVIRNLVSNAIKFTPSGGTVTLTSTSAPDDLIEVRVRDSGIGMTPELKKRLFLLNEKTSRQGTEGEPSTGLGLLLCKEFIEKNGGTIWVESEEGKGSTFLFTLNAMKI